MEALWAADVFKLWTITGWHLSFLPFAHGLSTGVNRGSTHFTLTPLALACTLAFPFASACCENWCVVPRGATLHKCNFHLGWVWHHICLKFFKSFCFFALNILTVSENSVPPSSKTFSDGKPWRDNHTSTTAWDTTLAALVRTNLIATYLDCWHWTNTR